MDQRKRQEQLGGLAPNYKYDGVTYNPVFWPIETLKKIEQTNFNADDIFIAVFPKSGTTWMQELVYMITTNGDTEAAMKTRSDERVPMLEMTIPGQPSNYDMIMKRSSPRLIKTHLYFKFFTQSLQQAKSKFIVVFRDPKDSLVSHFHQYQNAVGYNGSFDEFFEMYKQGEIVLGDPFDHAISWWENKDEENFLFTTYEEMKKDIRSVIRRVAEFLDKELSDDIAEKIVEHTSFENMKANPMTNKSELMDNFMRKGVIGDWVNFMSEDQRALVDSRAKEVHEKYGITF